MTIINPLPVTLQNGTTADATQVMADFNAIVSNVNANAAALAGPQNFTGAQTIGGDTICTLTAVQTLTNKTIAGYVTGTTVANVQALRGLLKTGPSTAFVFNYYAALLAATDGGGPGPVAYNSADTTSGCLFTGSIAPGPVAPAAPTLSQVAGGTQAARNEFFKVTYVTAAGETLASAESTIAVLVNQVPVVTSPTATTGATGYNVYGSSTTGTETLQNTTPIAIGTNWQEPNTGLISTGRAVPTASTAGSILTISAVTNGTVITGHRLSDIGALSAVNTYVAGQISGTGGTGTYMLTNSGQTIASETMVTDNGGTVFVAWDGGRWYAASSSAPFNVKRFGAKGDGATNDTSVFNALIAYLRSLVFGGQGYIPSTNSGYAVTEINATSATANFAQTVKLSGDARFASRIVPLAAGNILLNMMGSNDMELEELHFDSTAFASQCAIFLARSTTSTNCNNNKFRNVWTTGSYTAASVVNDGAESSHWIGGRHENTNAAANYRCFWSGGGAGMKALQNITVINGGTILDSGNPNTDNKMFGVEFYAPFNNAAPVRFSQGSEYQNFGCSIICGSSNNCHLVTYDSPVGGRFNGPITWFGLHREVFGTGNVVHYLNGGGAAVTFDGISSYGGYLNASNNTSEIDFDRTNINEQPILASATWTTPTTAPNSTGTNIYLYSLYNSSISFKPNTNDGSLFVFGFINANSVVDVTTFNPGATRYVGSIHNSVAAALPTTGNYTVGETIQRETPVVGQPLGWKCTVSGTLGTLNAGATTGSITINTNVLTLSSATGAAEGQRITIAGSSGGPYYIRKLVGTTAYLDSNAGATVAGAAVAFSNATLVALANL